MKDPSSSDAPATPGPERVTIEVPSMPIDAVQVVPTAFTIHLNVGTSLPDGRVVPRAHLALGIAFARHLHQQLAHAIAWAEARAASATSSSSDVDVSDSSDPRSAGAGRSGH